MNQYDSGTLKQRDSQDNRLRAIYSGGLGRLFCDTTVAVLVPFAFTAHVNQLLAEADQQLETQQ